MVMATAVDVANVGDIPANNLQDFLGAVVGKAQYAADAAGSALFKAEAAQTSADAIAGTANYAAAGVGTIDYHVRIIAGLVGYTGYPSSIG